MKNGLFTLLFVLYVTNVSAQSIRLDRSNLKPNQVTMSFEQVLGHKAVRVVKDSTVTKVDEPTFVRIEGVHFTNGTIELKVLSRLLRTAPDSARGFIGVAFRINEHNTGYESIYIRPTNGRAENQVRRNHSIQYYSYPDYKFNRLRKEAPERYESYGDMTLNKWITIKIVVSGKEARFYMHGNEQPSLIVMDLKHGVTSGGIGLWVYVGTEGFFTDLAIVKK